MDKTKLVITSLNDNAEKLYDFYCGKIHLAHVYGQSHTEHNVCGKRAVCIENDRMAAAWLYEVDVIEYNELEKAHA